MATLKEFREKHKGEKAKFWGFRAQKLHRAIAQEHAKIETKKAGLDEHGKQIKISESEIVRRAIVEYDQNHPS